MKNLKDKMKVATKTKKFGVIDIKKEFDSAEENGDSISNSSDEDETISSSSISVVLTLSEISSSESSLDEFYY